MKQRVTIIVCALVAVTVLFAQRGRYREPPVRQIDRGGVPMWEIDKQFTKDVFTFVRIKYSSSGYGYRGSGIWNVDHPDAELNLLYRLQQLTSMKVNPEGKVLELTDRDLFQ